MAKRLGGGNYLFESVDNWPKIDIPGVVSDVATDSERQRLPRRPHCPGIRRQHGRHPRLRPRRQPPQHLRRGQAPHSPRPLDHARRHPLPRRHLRPLHPHLLPRRRPRHDTGSPWRTRTRRLSLQPAHTRRNLSRLRRPVRLRWLPPEPRTPLQSRWRRPGSRIPIRTPQARLGKLRVGAHRLMGRWRPQLP